jgi:hypothetical protein
MSALLESIALSYAKSKGLSYITDEARKYAAKKLGVDTKNPKYAISIGNMNIDPMKIITNQAIKNAIGGGKISMGGGIPLIAGGLALAYARNPLREGSMNYNPALQGQIDYLSGMDGMIGKNQSSGLLQYGPNSVLRGKNVVSMFGNNDYAKNLQNYIDKMEAKKTKGYNTIGFGPFRTKTTNFTDFQQSQLNKAKKELAGIGSGETDIFIDEEVKEKRKNYVAPHHGSVHSSNGDNKDDSGKTNNKTNNTSSQKTSSRPSRHSSGPGGLHSGYRRGGIASL